MITEQDIMRAGSDEPLHVKLRRLRDAARPGVDPRLLQSAALDYAAAELNDRLRPGSDREAVRALQMIASMVLTR